jgi:hypothetical protein
MPSFFFHVRDGDRLIEDPDGSELPDLGTARTEAVAAARQALAELTRTDRALDKRRFEIADGAGRVLATVSLRDVIVSH